MSDYCQDENVFCNMLKNIMLYFLGSSLNLNFARVRFDSSFRGYFIVFTGMNSELSRKWETGQEEIAKMI